MELKNSNSKIEACFAWKGKKRRRTQFTPFNKNPKFSPIQCCAGFFTSTLTISFWKSAKVRLEICICGSQSVGDNAVTNHNSTFLEAETRGRTQLPAIESTRHTNVEPILSQFLKKFRF